MKKIKLLADILSTVFLVLISPFVLGYISAKVEIARKKLLGEDYYEYYQ